MLVTIAMVIVAVPLRPMVRNVLVVVVAIVIAVPVMIVMILSHGIKAKGKDYDKKSDESLHSQAPCRWKIRWDYSTGQRDHGFSSHHRNGFTTRIR